jgi:sec-independent protein translocase protein TatA
MPELPARTRAQSLRKVIPITVPKYRWKFNDYAPAVSEAPARERAMFGKLGMPELLVLFGIALLIFGPSKIGDLGKGLGEGIRSFKSAMKDGDQPQK